jgi:hypothetical protein
LSNLDAKLRLEMRAEIRRIHNTLGATTIYVTHDQEEALSLADRIVVMRDGEVRQVGTPEDLFSRPDHLDVAEFMGFRNKSSGPRHRRRSGGSGEVAVGDARRSSGRAAARSLVRGNGHVAIRPEDLHPRWPARAGSRRPVISTEFRGREFVGFARMADGTNLSFLATTKLEPGATVTLGADPERVLVFGGGRHERCSPITIPLQQRLAARGIDGLTLLVLPAVLFLLALFIYPFLYGLVLSFNPKSGGALANYSKFFSDSFLYGTIATTLWLALPVTLS